MNIRGKNKLIASLTTVIDKWLETVEPNAFDETDIGYVGEKTTKLMATVAITLLEANSEAQRYAMKEGFVKP